MDVDFKKLFKQKLLANSNPLKKMNNIQRIQFNIVK